MLYALFNVGDRVRMTDACTQRVGGPRLTGVVADYGQWHGMQGLLRVRRDADGGCELYAPYDWQRDSDGAIGKVPDATDLARIEKGLPIETTYGGHRFRSRLEARWAVFFDALGVAFEYEREGYKLPSGPYLPDFWIPQATMFAEVKPTKFSPREEDKCFELATQTGFSCLLLDGPPACKCYLAAEPEEDPDHVVRTFGSFVLTKHKGYLENQGRLYASMNNEIFPDTYAAVTAATSARFEHGESGHLPSMEHTRN